MTTKTTTKKAPANLPAGKAGKVAKTTTEATVTRKSASSLRKSAVSVTEAPVFAMDGSSRGTVALPPELFAVAWNGDLVHQVVVGMQANARPVTAHTKFRGEVSGGGKKPWKQKGTGRARHGSSRSPIWKGGGVTHGPRAEKIYSVKINKKMRSAALASVLSRKLQDNEIIFVDALTFSLPKTKEAVNFISALAKASGRSELATKRKNAAVIALMSKDANIEKSFSNIGSLMTSEIRNLNPVEVMNKKFLVIEKPAESLQILQARFTSKQVTGDTLPTPARPAGGGKAGA